MYPGYTHLENPTYWNKFRFQAPAMKVNKNSRRYSLWPQWLFMTIMHGTWTVTLESPCISSHTCILSSLKLALTWHSCFPNLLMAPKSEQPEDSGDHNKHVNIKVAFWSSRTSLTGYICACNQARYRIPTEFNRSERFRKSVLVQSQDWWIEQE